MIILKIQQFIALLVSFSKVKWIFFVQSASDKFPKIQHWFKDLGTEIVTIGLAAAGNTAYEISGNALESAAEATEVVWNNRPHGPNIM